MEPDLEYPIRLQMVQLRGDNSEAKLKSHIGKKLYLSINDRLVGEGVVTDIDLRFPDYVIITYMANKIDGLVAYILDEEMSCSPQSP